MNKINIITPPDTLHHRAYKFLLIYPDAYIQQELQNYIGGWDHPVDIYIYNEPEAHDWLLKVFEMADTVIVNCDDCDTQIRDLMSFLISFPKTYRLTQAENIVYNKLSLNRVYNLDFLTQIVGGTSEKKQQQ